MCVRACVRACVTSHFANFRVRHISDRLRHGDRMSDVRVPDISALEDHFPEQESNAQGAPLIQISHLHVNSGSRTTGTDNPGYENEQDFDEASLYSISRPVSPVSAGTAAQQRRYSCVDMVPPSGGLTIPNSGKGQSVQSVFFFLSKMVIISIHKPWITYYIDIIIYNYYCCSWVIYASKYYLKLVQHTVG